MKIAITGAAGFIGRYITNKARDLAHEVVPIDRMGDGVSVDIFSGDEDIFDQLGRPDALIHLAWSSGFVHNSPDHMGLLSDHYTFLRNYMLGGRKSVSVMGSMHEVGYWEGAIDENTPCNPMSQYGISKDALRRSMLLTAAELDVSLKWLRGFYIVSNDPGGNSIFAKIAEAEARGQATFPFTTGKNKYDFIDVEDLANQVIEASLQTEVDGVINVCSGKPVSLADRVEQFIRDNDYNIKLEYGAFPDRPYDSPAVWGDDKKIRKILEY